MTLLAPIMLWSLAALAPLAAVYLLRVRPTRKTVTTLFLFEQLVQQTQSTALLRRLRNVLSLLMLAAAFMALAMAMAKPVLQEQDDRDLILLIDNSASMNASDGSKTRLELARQAARDILTGLGGDKQAAVATVADDIRYLANLTDNHRGLIRAVDRAKPTHLPLRRSALARIAGDADNSRCRIILISDGSFAGADELGSAELLKVGQPLENVGITQFDLLRLPGRPVRIGLMFQLTSSLAETRTLDVTLYHETLDRVIKVCPVTVAPGVNAPEVFTVDYDASGKWLLRIEPDDALTDDDTAYAALPPRRPIRAGVAADSDSFFLSRCVQAFGVSDGPMVLTDSNIELIISSGAATVTASADRIIFAPAGQSPYWTDLGEVIDEAAAVKVLTPDHPAIQLCDLEMLNIAGQRNITPPAGAVVLASTADDVPLIYKAYNGDTSAFIVNIDPAESELFLTAQLPIMVYSMAIDLTGKKPQRRVSLPPGSAIPAMAFAPADAGELTDPDGSKTSIKASQGSQLTSPGFYELSADGMTRLLACSQTAPAESLLNNAAIKQTVGPLPSPLPPATLLLITALLLIACEAVLYHRRRVG